ncbi:hypothetical protein KI387_043555 [Taxus chinensis]|uniref:Receptor-like serine/threonine-protein kinase n=1 Tax=Taxus chinensis TaxID=29808 RepID=A0AA38C1H2_TAXCH|nr:hypothetical protein KI387_043555 [Taxus chinensis]
MKGYSYMTIVCVKLLVLALLVLLPSCDSLAVDGRDTLRLGASLLGNQTIISKNGTFELGFFSPNGTSNWYIGIWYAQIPEMTIIWVANRETPIKNMPGVLNLSGDDGHLRLFDLEGRPVWSSDNILKASAASILDDGNFIMAGTNNISEIVWESFGHPTDTWLPGIKQWKGLQLTSWMSSSDPAPGPFSFEMDPSPGTKQILLLYDYSIPYWYSGEWTGDHFSNLPELLDQKMIEMSFVTVSPSTMYVIFILNPQIQMAKARLVLHGSGQLRMYFWDDSNGWWNFVWSAPRDQCDVYNVCGAYGACNSNNIQFCTCLQGFIPKQYDAWDWDSQQWWPSSGCVRRSPLQCSAINGSTTDAFLQVTDKSLAVEQAVSQVTEQQCRSACLNNCSCTAFALANSTPPLCQLWFGDLLNARDSSDGQSVFIKLAASELRQLLPRRGRSRVPPLCVLLPSIAALTAVFALLIVAFIWWRLWHPSGLLNKEDKQNHEPSLLRTFTYRELQTATENFKHKLGKGAFGTVFKGSLADNTHVAVKQLEGSAQGEKQFRAEISTIGNIQHVNLVKLWGFCAEKSRRLLVYEYVSNGSLNSFLFHANGKVLDWNTRFQIALGTARGLRFQPRVDDYKRNERVLGSRVGLRPPHHCQGGRLQLRNDADGNHIGARRNVNINVQASKVFFPAWAATQLEKGNIASIVDTRIADKADIEEVRRAVAVGELCIEEEEDARPSMAQVVQILQGKMETLNISDGS